MFFVLLNEVCTLRDFNSFDSTWKIVEMSTVLCNFSQNHPVPQKNEKVVKVQLVRLGYARLV